jgi:hypothetical protein
MPFCGKHHCFRREDLMRCDSTVAIRKYRHRLAQCVSILVYEVTQTYKGLIAAHESAKARDSWRLCVTGNDACRQSDCFVGQ